MRRRASTPSTSIRAALGLVAAASALLFGVGAGTASAAPPPPPVVPAAPALPAVPAVPATPGAPAAVAGTPCVLPTQGEAGCIDLGAKRAFLVRDGKIVRSDKALGGTKKDPTPVGTFDVDFRDADHVSNLYDADMPNSVFFAPAVATHAGSLSSRSHGCVHLSNAASKAWFDTLRRGDSVQVVS